jgi:hypothetical protein
VAWGDGPGFPLDFFLSLITRPPPLPTPSTTAAAVEVLHLRMSLLLLFFPFLQLREA